MQLCISMKFKVLATLFSVCIVLMSFSTFSLKFYISSFWFHRNVNDSLHFDHHNNPNNKNPGLQFKNKSEKVYFYNKTTFVINLK